MRLDMNAAWQTASTMIRANRQVLVILAGVFFFLPGLAMTLFAPMPEIAEGMSGDAYFNTLVDYYSGASGLFLLMGLAQALGVLALIAFLGGGRPSLGEALQNGAKGLLTYILAQLLVGLGFALTAMTLAGLAAAIGGGAAVSLVLFVLLPGVLIVATRMSLSAPIIMMEGTHNPLHVLARSWALTRGNGLRLFIFYLLVFLAFMVVLMFASMLGGIIIALVLGSGQWAMAANGAISGIISAAMVVCFAAIIAAAHRQLAGGPENPDPHSF